MSNCINDGFEELVNSSGHNLHLEIAELLRSMEWQVEISPYYCDDMENKPREVDIIATKSVFSSFKIFLFIECKRFNKEVVFWLEKNNKQKALDAVNGSIVDIDIGLNTNSFAENHHYSKISRIAKLFETKENSKKSNKDIIFDAFTQSIKSLIFFRENHRVTYGKGLYYPVVVYEPKIR